MLSLNFLDWIELKVQAHHEPERVVQIIRKAEPVIHQEKDVWSIAVAVPRLSPCFHLFPHLIDKSEISVILQRNGVRDFQLVHPMEIFVWLLIIPLFYVLLLLVFAGAVFLDRDVFNRIQQIIIKVYFLLVEAVGGVWVLCS